MAFNIGLQLRGCLRIARAIAGDCQAPWQIGQRRQRRDQHVITFARHDGADRQQPYRIVRAAAAPDGTGSEPGRTTVMRSAGTA